MQVSVRIKNVDLEGDSYQDDICLFSINSKSNMSVWLEPSNYSSETDYLGVL